MGEKERLYANVAQQVSRQITDDFHDWTEFLRMAGRLYKYPFDQQLLIYAQRPEAVACAEAALWEQRMRRHIRDGSRSIVILDNSGKTPVLRYIFDFSDTEGGAEARRPWLWEYREEYHNAVAAALEKRFGRTGEDDMAARLDEISERLAKEYWNDRKEDILDAVPGSFLEEFDDFNIETSFLRAASVSMAYAMMSRCNLEPDEYFQRDDFLSVFDFNTPDMVSALGSAVSWGGEQVLREIEKAVKQYEREKQSGRSAENVHQTGLQAGRELSGSQSGFGRGIAAFGQIRPDETGVSARTSPRPVDAAVRQRQTVFPPVGSRGGGQRPSGTDNPRAGGISRGDGGAQSPRPHALGGAYERLQGAGGGNRVPESDLLLRRANPIEGQFSFFSTENEQIPPVPATIPTRTPKNRGEERVPRTEPVPADGNFRITDEHLGEGSAKARFRANMDAIRTLKRIESEGRSATREEQEILSRYAGWGGLADAFDGSKRAWRREFIELADALTPEEYDAARSSTLNAFYTSPTVIKAIYEAVENMGFRTGNILEPSCGTGNFFGLLPDSMRESRLYGVELDSVTGRIAKQLYPNADITISGFESTNQRDFFDLAIGNVPFGQYQVNDPACNRLGFSIHNYFFAKALDEVRPGGVVAFVTSRYTLDAQSPDVRKYLAKRAELLGAIRLPNNAFKANAGTEVVSDIVFLQKRDRLIDVEPDWVHLGRSANGFPINSYFAEHPEMILGRQSYRHTQYGEQDFTVKPFEGAELSELLREAVKRIGGTWKEADLPDLGENGTVSSAIPADPNVKNYSYAIVDGEPYYRRDSVMVHAELSGAAKERVVGMVGLRDCARRLIDLQMDERSPESAILAEQKTLNELYDNFTAQYGLINDRANRLAFSDDSAYYLLCSLEVLDEDGKLERKADFFTKRTIKQRRSVTRVDTVPDALAVSIGEKAGVDLEFMASLIGGSEKIPEIVESLRGVIYKDPSGGPFDYAEGGLCWNRGWQTADEYLSGNVRAKLRQARSAAVRFPEFQANVEALEKVQPKDLDASEIEVRLGSTWVDKEIFQRFMYETFDTPWYLKSHIQVEFSPVTAEWHITEKSAVGGADVAAYTTYGTERANAYKILEDSLNLRDVRIYDVVEDEDGKLKRVLNAKETTLAAQKQTLIREEFKRWIWSDPVRRRSLVQQYNEEMNSTRPREYDGSHLVFSGMNPEITLREHQLNAIAHIIYGGNTLLAHEVGAGKTFEMVAAAMESKRLGLCSKSIFVVPNHLVDQWSAEFLRLYPSANLLVTTKKDFEKRNRKQFCARIATGSYDAVIIGQSQFERIPISPERQKRLLKEEIAGIAAGIEEAKWNDGEGFSVKQMEKTKKSLEARLSKLQATEKKDDVVCFEELGVDRMFVDESDFYKNGFVYTKMRNVAGISVNEAQKSADMFAKCRYMDELTGNRGVIFASGTCISNSVTELFVLQRYLQYDRLREMGMAHFDCWASRFGETVTALELAPEGTGYRARTRFARFFNLPELMNLFKEVADIKTADQLNLPVPKVECRVYAAKPTETQKEMMAALSERASRIHARLVAPAEDNMLLITSDGRKLGLDQRLIDPSLPDEPGTKVNQCVENVLRFWREGDAEKLTQLIFLDISTPKGRGKGEGGFTVYDDIRQKLIANGMPPEQVAFIHDADTEIKKRELFAKVRAGQVRVLIGSTSKLGAGTNVQTRLLALHDLDCPWRPRDLTQRKGRIERQGNQNETVYVCRYVTEDSFDSYLWQTVEQKQRFISQIMTSKSPVRSCEDIDETILSFAAIKALCAGDPRIKERMDLDVEVSRLKLMRGDHMSKRFQLEDRIAKYFPEHIAECGSTLRGLETDMATLSAHPLPRTGFVGMEVGGKKQRGKESAGTALLDAVKAVTSAEPVRIGEYRGFALSAYFDEFQKRPVLTLNGALSYRVELGVDPKGSLVRLDNGLARIAERVETTRNQLENLRKQEAAAREELDKPFPYENELAEKTARLAMLDMRLNLDNGTEFQPEQTLEKSAQSPQWQFPRSGSSGQRSAKKRGRER